MIREGALGRRTPPDFAHVEKYPLRALSRFSGTETVERTLRLPWWHWQHDQGQEGSCVGHAIAMERAISNSAQNRLATLFRPTRWYDPLHVWNEAKLIDEWADTNPGDSNGTSVRAGYDVSRDQGLRRVKKMVLGASGVPEPVGAGTVTLSEGVATNRWAQSVDEMRAAIKVGTPIVIGVEWFSAFDRPIQKGREWFLPEPQAGLGHVRGGHAVCLYGASDRRQSFKMKNSWGRDYPLVWLPYTTMERLLSSWGEAAIVTDR